MRNMAKFVMLLLVLLLVVLIADASSLISTQTELCGPETDIRLGEDGESSAVTIILEPSEQTAVCKLRITAPHSHVIYMHFLETASEMHREFLAEHSAADRPCTLSVFIKENRVSPVWKGDPCSNDPLPDVDLLNPQLRLVWIPPDHVSHTKGRKLVVTAVGQGETCTNKGQHTCMSIGHKPLFCVSNHLVCDGNQNCPKGATKSDEDDKICTFPFSSLLPDKFAMELLKHLKPSHIVSNQFLNTLLSRSTESPSRYDNPWKDWKNLQKQENKIVYLPVTTESPVEEKHVSAIESFSIALSHYGPWGYIMLGMLICGTVLMFCGIWECVRRPKNPSETNSSQPTTVLIINNQQDENQPPRYDDIDPPSYTTLFPNFKLDLPIPVVSVQENQNAEVVASSNEETTGNARGGENSEVETSTTTLDSHITSENSDTDDNIAEQNVPSSSGSEASETHPDVVVET